MHEQRLIFDDKDKMEDDEHSSDGEEDSADDVEQFEDEGLLSDTEDEL